jgi:hypothetical protein
MGHAEAGGKGWRGKPLGTSREGIRRRVCGDCPEGSIVVTHAKAKAKPADTRKRSK